MVLEEENSFKETMKRALKVKNHDSHSHGIEIENYIKNSIAIMEQIRDVELKKKAIVLRQKAAENLKKADCVKKESPSIKDFFKSDNKEFKESIEKRVKRGKIGKKKDIKRRIKSGLHIG